MPFNQNNVYYLEDVEYNSRVSEYIIPSVYREAKDICEDRMTSQDQFNALVVFLGACGYTMQKQILKTLRGESS